MRSAGHCSDHFQPLLSQQCAWRLILVQASRQNACFLSFQMHLGRRRAWGLNCVAEYLQAEACMPLQAPQGKHEQEQGDSQSCCRLP